VPISGRQSPLMEAVTERGRAAHTAVRRPPAKLFPHHGSGGSYMVRKPAVIGIERTQPGFSYFDAAGKLVCGGDLTIETPNASWVITPSTRGRGSRKDGASLEERYGHGRNQNSPAG
jgi:hypothetical protein